MRIALVASLVSPMRAAEANGPHAVIIDLARGLAARGHRVTVYAAAGSAADGVDVVEIPVEPEARGAELQFAGSADGDATAALNRGFARLFARLRHDAPDVVSQHAFDAAAIALAEGMPVLHTLHLPPIVSEVVAAARVTRASLATVSNAARESWLRAGVGHLGVLRNGVPDAEPARGITVPIGLIASATYLARGLDRDAIRARAQRQLGVEKMVDAYERALTTVAALDQTAALAS